MIEYTVRVYADGSKEWWLNGRLHREDGPAVEYADGSKEWWLNGRLHRTDGPAVEYASGSKFWFLNDVELTEQEFNLRTQRTLAGKEIVVDGVRYRLTALTTVL